MKVKLPFPKPKANGVKNEEMEVNWKVKTGPYLKQNKAKTIKITKNEDASLTEFGGNGAMEANQFCRLLIRDQGYELVIMKVGDTGRDKYWICTDLWVPPPRTRGILATALPVPQDSALVW